MAHQNSKKMLTIISQQSTFQRYAASKSVINIFLFLLFSMCHYAVNLCDKLRFCIYYSITTNTNIKINH